MSEQRYEGFAREGEICVFFYPGSTVTTKPSSRGTRRRRYRRSGSVERPSGSPPTVTIHGTGNRQSRV